jgi:hypothetical protein
LGTLLVEHGMDTRRQHGLVFGTTEEKPFTPRDGARSRTKAWKGPGWSRSPRTRRATRFASMAIVSA